MLYRELVVRAYGKEAIKKIDKMRLSGVDMTDFILGAVMTADIKQLLKEQKAKRELALV
jgi:hypothetical protein